MGQIKLLLEKLSGLTADSPTVKILGLTEILGENMEEVIEGIEETAAAGVTDYSMFEESLAECRQLLDEFETNLRSCCG